MNYFELGISYQTLFYLFQSTYTHFGQALQKGFNLIKSAYFIIKLQEGVVHSPPTVCDVEHVLTTDHEPATPFNPRETISVNVRILFKRENHPGLYNPPELRTLNKID